MPKVFALSAALLTAPMIGCDDEGPTPVHVVDGGTDAGTDAGTQLEVPSVARRWDDATLSAIRRNLPNPGVHARNLFHLSVAMYDAWAIFDPTADGLLVHEKVVLDDPVATRRAAVSYAAYRVLKTRYAAGANAAAIQADFDELLVELGYDTGITTTVGDTGPAIGNRVAATVLATYLNDGAGESMGYADPSYVSVNSPLVVELSGANMQDPNRWQPLALDVMISQNGIPIPDVVQKFVGSQWGGVAPFALTRTDPLRPYHDPGPPPQLGGVGHAELRDSVVEVIRLQAMMDPTDPTTIDLSPGAHGNNTLGENDGAGRRFNPITGLPYASHVVPRADFARVLAEFWADGPHSETPPGHWNVLANEVADSPGFERRRFGTGPSLDPLEWDVTTYFALNAALHDAAIAAWGLKRAYDSARPICLVRYMSGLGQSSDPLLPSYHANGLPLVPGVIELITDETTAFGERHAALVGHEGEIAVRAWLGQPPSPDVMVGGVGWILGTRWMPYQRATFVTPAFPGFVSGHSTFSRSAATVLATLTGSEYFPGGFAEFIAPAHDYLVFEDGPTVDVHLQWATYYDAADQAGRSRIYGGIHIDPDDHFGRTLGDRVGRDAVSRALSYELGFALP